MRFNMNRLMRFSLLPLPLWPSLTVAPALIVLVMLGVWQLYRLDFKETYLTALSERMEMAPISLPQTRPLDVDAWQFKPIRISGRFRHDQEIHVLQRDLNGEEGLHIYTPFELSKPAPESVILVDRGYVPFDKKLPETRIESKIEGEQEIIGLIRFDEGGPTIRNWVLPEPELDTNLWYALDIRKINQLLNQSYPLFYLMDGNDQQVGGYPKGRQWKADIRNDHLHYAITWFSLAIGLAVIFVVFVRNWRKQQ